MTEVLSLLKEYEAERLSDRRMAPRKPLVRPVRIVARHRRNEVHEAFSKNVSSNGIGIIGKFDWPPKSVARISVHMTKGNPINIDAELRWSEPYGKGWFTTGWVFL